MKNKKTDGPTDRRTKRAKSEKEIQATSLCIHTRKRWRERYKERKSLKKERAVLTACFHTHDAINVIIIAIARKEKKQERRNAENFFESLMMNLNSAKERKIKLPKKRGATARYAIIANVIVIARKERERDRRRRKGKLRILPRELDDESKLGEGGQKKKALEKERKR